MTFRASCLNQEGVCVRDIAIDERIDRADDRSQFVWSGLCDPCAEEIATLADLYGLHPLAIEDAFKDGQLPKVDVYGDQLFVIARTAPLDDTAIDYCQTAVFVGHSHITVRQGSDRSHGPLRDQLEAAPFLLGQGVDYVLHSIPRLRRRWIYADGSRDRG